MNIRALRILVSDMKKLSTRMDAVEEKLGIKPVEEVEKPAEKPPVEIKKKQPAKKKRKPSKPFPKQKK